MVIDYRKLNDITIKNAYPLPRIDELIQKWKGCIYFSALDIRSGYYNVRMREGDEWKTAFLTNRGLFESLVMTFGQCNAPGTFQTMMDSIFIVQIRRGDTGTFIDDLGIGTGPDPRGILPQKTSTYSFLGKSSGCAEYTNYTSNQGSVTSSNQKSPT